ncbi:hypothetical protein PO909_004558, partial [Leuciscus waleckii]
YLLSGQFDGSTSWREFLNRFEDCARANHCSERTMTVQMRFCLVGAAGSVIHKNPRTGRWDYTRIVEEIDAAYGPSSEHAAAIGIELRQRVCKAGHVLRDDIYEKVSIVYADRSEREQDSISVEVFTNTMGGADIVQRLLEERPRTLSRAYDIAHRYETTQRTAASVTQLMQSATRPMEQRARAAAVCEYPEPSESEGEGNQKSFSVPRQKPFRMESKPHQLRFNKRGKINWEEIVCHNCHGIGHMRRNCPSPRLDLPRVIPYVAEMRERFELAHQIAREQLGHLVEHAKKQYYKNVARTHYKVGDAVWYLIKGTKRMKNKIRKFLPAFEGPYFVLGHLDDMIYRIQKGPKTKVKVVHHDKLKPYYSRQPLGNSWVF